MLAIIQLLFNKIESSIGVDKWVKVLDIQEKPFMNHYTNLFFHIWKKTTENI